MAAALWSKVYAGLTPKSNDSSTKQIRCEELCSAYVEVAAATNIERGKTKRPPMCHIVAFNHISWAADWLAGNKSQPAAQGYKGPDAKGYDSETWKKLVWDETNLRPGHAKCNSMTAAAARGIPSTTDAKEAITYTVARLKSIKPGWF